MKHSILLLLSFTILICGCTSSNHENSLQNENLNGKVKSITISHYKGEIVPGRVVAKDYLFSPIFAMTLGKEYNSDIAQYDQYGSVAKLYYGKDGLFDSINIYDKNLNLIHKSLYDKDGKILKKERYQDGSISDINEYKYQGDCLIECIYKDNYGESSTKYKSNSNGIIEEIIDYNEDGLVEWKQTNTIEKNKIIKSILYPGIYLHPENYEDIEDDAEDALPIVTTYTYQDDKLSVVERTKGMDKSVYFINEHGKIDKCEINHTPLQYHYNANNDLEMRNDLYHFEYVYDDMNNWIKRVSYHHSKPLQIDLREIEYY